MLDLRSGIETCLNAGISESKQFLTLIIVAGLKILIRAATIEFDRPHCEITVVRACFMAPLAVCTENWSVVIANFQFINLTRASNANASTIINVINFASIFLSYLRTGKMLSKVERVLVSHFVHYKP